MRLFALFAGTVLLTTQVIGCTSVPDSVKIAIKREGEAIRQIEQDHKISVEAYHQELLRQIDLRLDDIFQNEIQKMAQSQTPALNPQRVIELDQMRKQQRDKLHQEAEEVKNRLMNSKNLEILKTLHQKIENFAESDQVKTEDLDRLLEEIEPLIASLKK